MSIRRIVFLFALASILLSAQSSEEIAVKAVVQKLFDGMAAHDAKMMGSVMLPDARLYWTRDEAAPKSTSSDEFLAHVSKLTNNLVERFTEPATVLVHGRTAQVWGKYEFLLDGKPSHCGVDSFSLLKVADGWKIASVVYTSETSGCPGH